MNRSSSIFVSTRCIIGTQPICSRLALYNDHGLDSVELGGGVCVNKDDLSILVGMKGQFLVHNYFPPPQDPFVLNLGSADEEIRYRSIDLVSEALILSNRLGSPFYSVHSGFITDPTSFGNTSFVFPKPSFPGEAQHAMHRFSTALETVMDRAQNLGLQVLLENNVVSSELRGKLLLQTANEFLILFRNLPFPNLGILLDTGHLNVTAQTLGFDRMTFVDEVSHYIRAFHVHDNDGTEDTHSPIKSDSWVLEVLRQPKFNGLPIVVEAMFDNIVDLRRHVDWLKDALQR